MIFWSHEVESAIPIAYSAWWNHQEDVGSIPTGDELSICDYHQEDVGSIPTGDELSICDYKNLIISRRNL